MQEEKKKNIERIYNRFWKELAVVAYRRLHSEEEVEDVLHDIFLSLLTGNLQLENEDSVRALLHQRLKSRIINFYRRKMLRITFEEETSLKSEISDIYSDSHLMSRELEIIVQEEIERMPEKMKEIFLLSRNDFLTSEEIAVKLDLSRQTVRNQISLAIKRIKVSLEIYRKTDLSPASLHIMITLAAYLLSKY